MARKVVLLAVLGLVAAQWVVLPGVTAVLAARGSRGDVRVPGLAEVRFAASDGVRLAGSYARSRNGTTVVVAHGSHGDRRDTLAHVRMLRSLGYGVLTFDARGSGESAGRANAFGWHGTDDVRGAVAYLRAHGERRIVGLGLSMGAEELLRAAADGVPLRAIVADGAGASTLGDQELVARGPTRPIEVSVDWVTMRLVELASRAREPRPLNEIVHRVRVPTLLIASRADDELALDGIYASRMPHARVWSVPDAAHTEALLVHPVAYARRVAAVLGQ